MGRKRKSGNKWDEEDGSTMAAALGLVIPRKDPDRKVYAKPIKSKISLEFDEGARRDYLTGFHKRKKERRKIAEEQQKEKERLERIRMRKERRSALPSVEPPSSANGIFDDSEEDDDLLEDRPTEGPARNVRVLSEHVYKASSSGEATQADDAVVTVTVAEDAEEASGEGSDEGSGGQGSVRPSGRRGPVADGPGAAGGWSNSRSGVGKGGAAGPGKARQGQGKGGAAKSKPKHKVKKDKKRKSKGKGSNRPKKKKRFH